MTCSRTDSSASRRPSRQDPTTEDTYQGGLPPPPTTHKGSSSSDTKRRPILKPPRYVKVLPTGNSAQLNTDHLKHSIASKRHKPQTHREARTRSQFGTFGAGLPPPPPRPNNTCSSRERGHTQPAHVHTNAGLSSQPSCDSFCSWTESEKQFVASMQGGRTLSNRHRFGSPHPRRNHGRIPSPQLHVRSRTPRRQSAQQQTRRTSRCRALGHHTDINNSGFRRQNHPGPHGNGLPRKPELEHKDSASFSSFSSLERRISPADELQRQTNSRVNGGLPPPPARERGNTREIERRQFGVEDGSESCCNHEIEHDFEPLQRRADVMQTRSKKPKRRNRKSSGGAVAKSWCSRLRKWLRRMASCNSVDERSESAIEDIWVRYCTLVWFSLFTPRSHIAYEVLWTAPENKGFVF